MFKLISFVVVFLFKCHLAKKRHLTEEIPRPNRKSQSNNLPINFLWISLFDESEIYTMKTIKKISVKKKNQDKVIAEEEQELKNYSLLGSFFSCFVSLLLKE